MSIISILETEVTRFNNHLREEHNSRIIFSAPFGFGKTTFLKEIATAGNDNVISRNDEYNFFHIYPVNYSVATNEDIFQYIKYDLMYLIINKGITLHKSDVSFLKGISKYIKANAHILASKLFLFVPSVGKDLLAIFDELNKVKDEIMDALEAEKVDEGGKFYNYLLEIQGKAGSIYEMDIYTKIISNILARVKTTESGKIKQNVLIIDDLDRIDPAHIFRLMNVFSAHFDIDSDKNKFGFDKIVFVCDLNNIRKMFAHQYGQRVDFNGYIDKFYSTSVFDFLNTQTIRNVLDENLKRNNLNGYILDTTDLRAIREILLYMILNGKLNIRRIIHTGRIKVNDNISNRINMSYSKSKLSELDLLQVSHFLLSTIGNYESMMNVINECHEVTTLGKNDLIYDVDYSYIYSRYIIPVLAHNTHQFKTGIFDFATKTSGDLWRYKLYNDNRHYAVEIVNTSSRLYNTDNFWMDLKSAIEIFNKNALI